MANPGPPRPADLIFPERRRAIESDTCAICQGDASAFKNDISEREYLISGLCQSCQDGTFD